MLIQNSKNIKRTLLRSSLFKRCAHLDVQLNSEHAISHHWSKLSSLHYSMRAWKVDRSSPKLTLAITPVPTISSNDVLIKVHASSINPLDSLMRHSYGSQVFDLIDYATNFQVRNTLDRYPLTLGRDFSGEIVSLGANVTNFKKGDQVFGCVEPYNSGSHSEYICASSSLVASKPTNLSHCEAASVPYVGLTALSAISTFGRLKKDNCRGKQVLVLGGSGGVGSFAVQLLKNWGSHVTATCSESKAQWLKDELVVDQVVNYNDHDLMKSYHGKFDFVLDAASPQDATKRNDSLLEGLNYLIDKSTSTYVTLSSPLLKNIDESGLLEGTVKSLIQAVQETMMGASNLNQAKWAFFTPNSCALNYIKNELQNESIKPCIWKVFSFDNIEEAYNELESRNVQGKVIVEL